MSKSFTKRLRPVILLVAASSLILPAKAQSTGQAATQQVIDKIELTIKNGKPEDVQPLVDELKKQGAQATKSIQATLAAQNQFRATLVGVLGGIPGDESTMLLMKLALQDPNGNLAALCMQGLENRPINQQLTDRELQALIARVQNADVIQAGLTARLLARCSGNDVMTRAKPIIARFKKEIGNPNPINQPHGSYLTGQTYALNQFLLAFSFLNDAAVGNALTQEIAATGDANTKKWLTIAKGFTGDNSVAPNLQTIVQQDKELSIRAVALRAYARAAKEKALPFLMTFVEDKTLAGHDSHGELYPLRIVSQGEVAMLKSKPAEVTP